MNYKDEFLRWKKYAIEEIKSQLDTFNDKEIKDSFCKNLTFGTGGLRGIIGAGTNRMNVHTVAKASQGLSNYLIKNYNSLSVVIGYDSRIKSDVFAKIAASVFAKNNIRVFLWPNLNPVPTVSFATRYLHAVAGIMITASHNPCNYNGYKVYGIDGCQITTESAEKILSEIEKLDIFKDVKTMDFDEAVNEGRIEFIDPSVLTEYINCVKSESVLFGDYVDRNISIVYTPLNGTGYIPITRTLSEMGYTNITLVEEQRLPNGKFPTCPYPNPEVKESLSLGIENAKKINADLLLATDPDCDRVGIAVKNAEGKFKLLSGNEVGVLLLDYICSQRLKHDKMPIAPVMVKTIVTTDLGERIASKYKVRTIDVLTGFKFIGEQIGILEKEGNKENFIFGFEESYGYLTGTYVRDKDGVNAACMICEMFCFYKTKGITLFDKLNEIYKEFGYCLNTLHCFEYEGESGFTKMLNIMMALRKGIDSIGVKKVLKTLDYSKGINNLPKSNVLKFVLDDNCCVVVRPSGTEPKLKIYISISAKNKDEATEQESILMAYIKLMMQSSS